MFATLAAVIYLSGPSETEVYQLTNSKGHGLQFEMGGFRFVLCLLIFIACDHNYDWQQFLVMCYNNCLVLCVIGSSFNLLKFLNFTCHWLHVVSVFNFTLFTWPSQNTWWIWEKIASCRKCHSQCAIVINNYSSSPNGLWANSPWRQRPNELLTQRPWRQEEKLF